MNLFTIQTKNVTSGAVQVSILGPDLWNIIYDDIFRVEMPDGTHLVGYADDIAVIIVAEMSKRLKERFNQLIIRTKKKLEDRELKLTTEKTPLEIYITTCNTTLTTRKVVNYLGVRLDPKLTFWAQIQHATTKAARAFSCFTAVRSGQRH